MVRVTQSYKHSFANSIGSGISSVFGGSEKWYYIFEHKIGSKYHHAGELQEIIIDRVEIGRDPACQVRFDEVFETVSRRHAAVVRDGSRLKLMPLSQTNPTLLNGKKVLNEMFLHHGDEIQCAINGPKLVIKIPSGKNATTGSIRLNRRFYLFGKQALIPHKKTFIVLICTILTILFVGGLFVFFK